MLQPESAGKREGVSERICDVDLGAHAHLDGRRLKIVVDGSQLAATTNGKSLARARRRKERTYPELTGEHGRAMLVEAAGLQRPACF